MEFAGLIRDTPNLSMSTLRAECPLVATSRIDWALRPGATKRILSVGPQCIMEIPAKR